MFALIPVHKCGNPDPTCKIYHYKQFMQLCDAVRVLLSDCTNMLLYATTNI